MIGKRPSSLSKRSIRKRLLNQYQIFVEFMISFAYHAISFACRLPASSFRFRAGEWMVIARQSSGEGAIAEDEARRGRETTLTGRRLSVVSSRQPTTEHRQLLRRASCLR